MGERRTVLQAKSSRDGTDYRAKVLLSDTLYKPFTYADEVQSGDEHHRDLLEVSCPS